MHYQGRCSKLKIVYGVVTISDKGQIVIPIDLRKDLHLKRGDRLIVLKRRDDAGFTLLKLDEMDELMYKVQEDDAFLKRKGGDRVPTCKDCKFYEPIDETKGNCFGHEVPADRDVEECPAKAFQPKEAKEEK